MITKYVVKDDNIELYDGEDVVLSMPNTKENVKLAKLYNNQVFVDMDLIKATLYRDEVNSLCTKEAIKTLLTWIAIVASTFLNVPLITMIFVFMSMMKIVAFSVYRGETRSSDKRIQYLKGIQKKITEEIYRIQNTICKEKENNGQLTFSNDQIVEDHRNWVTEYGDQYNYSNDVDVINNAKVKILVRK